MAVPGGIGPISRIGPGGAYAGRVVGLVPLLGAVARYGPAVTTAVELGRMAKDFNDRPSGHVVGSHRGRVVVTGGRGGEPFTTPEQDEEDAWVEARARQASRENRTYYNRTVGTPRRRPMQGGLGTPGDTSDLGNWTP
jgi:hypothetical protein